jgi:hypothetical protein
LRGPGPRAAGCHRIAQLCPCGIDLMCLCGEAVQVVSCALYQLLYCRVHSALASACYR